MACVSARESDEGTRRPTATASDLKSPVNLLIKGDAELCGLLRFDRMLGRTGHPRRSSRHEERFVQCGQGIAPKVSQRGWGR